MRTNRRVLLAMPPASMLLHLFWQLGWIPTPQSAFEWGITATGVGFATLLGSLWLTWHLGQRRIEDYGARPPARAAPD